MNDFFLSNQLQRVPNERYLFVKLLSFSGEPNALLSLFLHYISTLGLLAGVDKIAQNWVKSPTFRLFGIYLALLILYGINLGGNEMYYPFFTNSYLAQVLGVWAIYYWLKGDPSRSSIYLILAALMHILIGLHLLLLVAGSTFLTGIVSGNVGPLLRKWSIPLIVWTLTAGVYFVLLYQTVSQGDIDSPLLFEIMEFRLAHHFFPEYFPAKSWLLIVPMFIAGIYYSKTRTPKVYFLLLLTLTGCVVYSVGIYIFRSPTILNTQWFESTIWGELICALILTGWLETKLSPILKIPGKRLYWSLAILTVVLILVYSPFPIFKSHHFGSPLGKGPEQQIDISQKVSQLNNDEVIFALPPDFTAFKWYAQKPTYVDYKAMLHHKQILPDWYRRIKLIYGIDIQDRKNQRNMFDKAISHLGELVQNSPESLKTEGITHVILPIEVEVLKQPILRNAYYAVYQLE